LRESEGKEEDWRGNEGGVKRGRGTKGRQK